MTREEAIEEMKKYGEGSFSEVIVNQIYDDFKSRTCGNCKHQNNMKCKHPFLSHMVDSSAFGWVEENFETKEDFGCKKWEAKDV